MPLKCDDQRPEAQNSEHVSEIMIKGTLGLEEKKRRVRVKTSTQSLACSRKEVALMVKSAEQHVIVINEVTDPAPFYSALECKLQEKKMSFQTLLMFHLAHLSSG